MPCRVQRVSLLPIAHTRMHSAMLDSPYHWVKAFHIIAVIAWMAGQLYLPRLFVYHAGVAKGSETSELFKVMERRLLRAIMNPAMVVTWALGLWLAWYISAFNPENGLWMHFKLLLVLGLSASHGIMSKWRKDFATDANTKSPKFFKIFNEIQTVLLIGAVILVVVRPL